MDYSLEFWPSSTFAIMWLPYTTFLAGTQESHRGNLQGRSPWSKSSLSMHILQAPLYSHCEYKASHALLDPCHAALKPSWALLYHCTPSLTCATSSVTLTDQCHSHFCIPSPLSLAYPLASWYLLPDLPLHLHTPFHSHPVAVTYVPAGLELAPSCQLLHWLWLWETGRKLLHWIQLMMATGQ